MWWQWVNWQIGASGYPDWQTQSDFTYRVYWHYRNQEK